MFNIRNTFLIALDVTVLSDDFIPSRNQMSKLFAMKENEKEMRKNVAAALCWKKFETKFGNEYLSHYADITTSILGKLNLR